MPQRKLGLADVAQRRRLEVRRLHIDGQLMRRARCRQRLPRVALAQQHLRQVQSRAAFERACADGPAELQRVFQVAPGLRQLAEPEPVTADVGERDGLALRVAEFAPDRQVLQVQREACDLIVLLAGNERKRIEQHTFGPAQPERARLGQALARDRLAGRVVAEGAERVGQQALGFELRRRVADAFGEQHGLPGGGFLGAVVGSAHAEQAAPAGRERTPAVVVQRISHRLQRIERSTLLGATALQEASVIGQVFWDQALAALDAKAPAALPALVGRGLTLPRQEAGLDDVREYGFSHQILHGVTYGTLLKRAKRVLHGRAAAWLAGLTGARASDFLGATAEHFELAGDMAQACVFFTRAAEHAKSRYAHDAALRFVSRALDLLERSPALEPREAIMRWRLLFVREYALNLQRQPFALRQPIEPRLQCARQ